MLKGIPKLISPELLKILAEMGHGDEIVIADANFPAETYGKRVVRYDGIAALPILNAVLSLIPLDGYAEANAYLMNTTATDRFIPPIWDEYEKALACDENTRLTKLERFDFYEQAKRAYAVIATGETALYGNLILKKGVINQ